MKKNGNRIMSALHWGTYHSGLQTQIETFLIKKIEFTKAENISLQCSH